MKHRRQRRLSRQLIRILNYGDRGNDRVHVGKLEQFQDARLHSAAAINRTALSWHREIMLTTMPSPGRIHGRERRSGRRC